MGTVHVITVGLSILDSLTDTRTRAGESLEPFGVNAKESLHQGIINIAATVAQPSQMYANNCWGAVGTALEGNQNRSHPMGQLRLLLNAMNDDDAETDEERKSHVHLASAELQGFWLGNGKSLKPRKGDSVVFLASDSTSGKIAAFWNAGLLLKGDFRTVRRIDSPSSAVQQAFEADTCYIVKVPNLNAQKIADFVVGLGEFARWLSLSLRLNSSADSRTVKLHLSGGFKIALPYFLAMGEWIISELPEESAKQVSAHATHIDSEEHYVELPLRRISQHSNRSRVQQELEMIIRIADSNNDKVELIPPTQSLAGYAYQVIDWHSDRQNFAIRITTLGKGYAEFLKHRPKRQVK